MTGSRGLPLPQTKVHVFQGPALTFIRRDLTVNPTSIYVPGASWEVAHLPHFRPCSRYLVSLRADLNYRHPGQSSIHPAQRSSVYFYFILNEYCQVWQSPTVGRRYGLASRHTKYNLEHPISGDTLTYLICKLITALEGALEFTANP